MPSLPAPNSIQAEAEGLSVLLDHFDPPQRFESQLFNGGLLSFFDSGTPRHRVHSYLMKGILVDNEIVPTTEFSVRRFCF